MVEEKKIKSMTGFRGVEKGGELRQVKPKIQKMTSHCPQIMFYAMVKWWQTSLILMARIHEGGDLGCTVLCICTTSAIK